MAIPGISLYADLQNNYRSRTIKSVDVETVKQQEQQKAKEAASDSLDVSKLQSPEADKRRAQRVANLQDISFSFNRNEDYGYIGQESSLENLDMQKAISDMKKDSVLQEYHYFLGAPENTSGAGMIQSASEDGRVILK